MELPTLQQIRRAAEMSNIDQRRIYNASLDTMPKYSIIIPVCNQPELTKACLDSVAAHSHDHEVIVVDNGSSPAWRGPEFCIRNEKNLGFPVAINQGIKRAVGEIIVLLNNDTVVSAGWLDRLSHHLKSFDLVGPMTNRVSGPQQLSVSGFPLPDGILGVSEDVYRSSAGRAIPFHRLVFFCVAIKREVIDKIGLLDERFSPGNFEDDDYCLRAIEAGFRLGIATDCFIYHAGGSTHKALSLDYTELLRVNSEKLAAKFPAERIEYLKKFHQEMCASLPALPKRSLALVMVVKNEAKGLERAILSVRDFVDEIVIAVDRSSSDGTEEIAKKYATTLKHFDWCDDFAWARNFAHEGVKTDWLLFLDGHEFVSKCENLRMMLESPADGLLCTVELESGAQIRNPRIYRNGLYFAGAVHEMQNCKSLSVYSDFVVKHDRVTGQSASASSIRSAQRNDQLDRIMGKQLKDDPSNIRAAFHLALHRQSLGDFRGALRYQKQYFKYAKMPGERWYVYFNQALCHFALGHELRALWATDKAEKETPARWEIAKLRGLIYFRLKNYRKAIKFFVDSFDVNRLDETFKPWPRADSEVWNLIGESYFRLNRFDLAGEAFKQASDRCPDEKKKKLFFDRSQMMLKLSRLS